MAFSTATFILAVLINLFIIVLYPFNSCKFDINEKANYCALAFLGLLPIYLHTKFEYRWTIAMFMISLISANTIDEFIKLMGIACVVTKCCHIFGILYEIWVKKPSQRDGFRNVDLQVQSSYLLIAIIAMSYNPLLFSILVN